MKKLTKKSKFKSLKQQVINRIGQCKSIKELEQINRCLSYFPVLKDNYEWDFDFLINIIEFKLIRMRDYFLSANIVVNSKLYAKQIDKALDILNAGYHTKIVLSKNLYTKVNTRNANKYLTPSELDLISGPGEFYDKYFLAILREAKAKQIFWKYLNHYIEQWWD